MGTFRDFYTPNKPKYTMKRLKEVYGIIKVEVREISVNGMVGRSHGSGKRGG